MVISHPECPHNILEVSDFIGGTEAMRREVVSVETPTTFLVATGANMIYALEQSARITRLCPSRGNPASTGETCACNRCPHMALNTLAAVRDCLRDGTPEITWQPYFESAREWWLAACSTDRHNRYHVRAGRGVPVATDRDCPILWSATVVRLVAWRNLAGTSAGRPIFEHGGARSQVQVERRRRVAS
ncbi:MAG: hypothetical protein CM1200mP2_44710 [Planctomycetaceae bacterium]|nr:MAG: hypothetical protein CM1200mP2_44710 [Planctomycetaceae bacterium]